MPRGGLSQTAAQLPHISACGGLSGAGSRPTPPPMACSTAFTSHPFQTKFGPHTDLSPTTAEEPVRPEHWTRPSDASGATAGMARVEGVPTPAGSRGCRMGAQTQHQNSVLPPVSQSRSLEGFPGPLHMPSSPSMEKDTIAFRDAHAWTCQPPSPYLVCACSGCVCLSWKTFHDCSSHSLSFIAPQITTGFLFSLFFPLSSPSAEKF